MKWKWSPDPSLIFLKNCPILLFVWCAWNSNPGQQDGRRRRIHWAMAAPLSHIWTRVIFANDNGVTGYLPTYLPIYLPTYQCHSDWCCSLGSTLLRSTQLETDETIKQWRIKSSVTRLGNLLHFGQLFKVCCNNYFSQFTHIFWQFLLRCQNLSFF